MVAERVSAKGRRLLTAVLGAGDALAGPVGRAHAWPESGALLRSRVAGWGVPMILLAFAHAPYWRYLMFGLMERPRSSTMRDGQPGERFYMITDGRVRVSKDGKELRQMATGESFGEIALLREVPRTATVIAMSRLPARTLTREEFLCAVTGNAASAEGGDEVISARLQAG